MAEWRSVQKKVRGAFTLSVAALLDRPGIDARRVESSTPASSPANRHPSQFVQADDESGIVNFRLQRLSHTWDSENHGT
jgi:hypothetical protein